MRRRAAALLVVAGLAAGCGSDAAGPGQDGSQAPVQPPVPSSAGPIDAGGIAEHLRALQDIAERSGGNRAAGTDGDRRTADYIAGRLRAAGWRVRLQSVRVPFFDVQGTPRVGDLRRGRDFVVLRFSGTGRFDGRVRPFDTPGCRSAELGRLRATDIVVLPRGTCTFARKARAVQRAGGGALVIADRGARRPVHGSLGAPGIRIPVVAVSGDAAGRLSRGSGRRRLDVRTLSEHRTTRNVLADSPGRASRVAAAGAHLDSAEEGPGMNDNGSGVAALLEIAERGSAQPGLRLGFWAAEEAGLVGSRRYVASLDRARRRRLVAYLNLDMIGSPRPSRMVYDTGGRIERLLRAALPGKEAQTPFGGASDHAPFERAGIPVGGLFTGAGDRVRGRPADPCYHRACDDIDNVDEVTAAVLARAAERVLVQLARRPGR